ncbi:MULTISPECIES: toprim domain-containing protein [Ruminococcus]|uniref:DNA topoisomerase (ATP-hydrolyzing) n=1 Tax=Ruminococcus albus 8 TaxID=246199 RepID=E9SAJ0_RUMAL|nr:MULTISPECIES: toprim domain-containing protein [Ruminococcus]MBE6872331.1 DNA topoisomerase [Ruminococcus albus]EGC03655.1 DNA gyrase, B subunit, C-terminal domain protein [Ruminococcus albus 8]MBO5558268.1 DNA topoisomerase [Ruminococcus sp.]MBR0529060.1 DNA topoisomerase [Ruminococcus sp.]MCC3349822.1 DNA topoisomerase [Ruminococcus albus 8]
MANKKQDYANDDITMLKGADRVRKRPAVIFGSDGIDGCQHSVFEILSNSIDEAREGHGDKIIVTKYDDNSIEVQDFGRGCPVDYNQREKRYNWELVYCELYAGGKFDNNSGENYSFALGLNGLGACATQYSSEYMDVEVFRDGYKYDLHFEKGENKGGLKKEETKQKKTGTRTHWKPDLDVFTDINIDKSFFEDVMKKQAVVNPGVTFLLRVQRNDGTFEEQTFFYENGIADYVKEIAGEDTLTNVQYFTGDRRGRDRADKDEYKVKLGVSFVFSNKVQTLEYFHNSSFLSHGGSPDDAVRSAFTSQINAYLKNNNKYNKNEKPINFQDVADCLVLVSSSFSTQTSYANQTKKAITNKFIKECMTEFLKHNLEVYFIENPDEALKIAEQVLVNKRSRESAETSRLNIKKKLQGTIDLSNQVQKFVDCRSKDLSRRELYIVEGDSALGSVKLARDAEFQAVIPVRGKILNCLKADYDKIFKNEIITDLIKVLGCGVEVNTGKKKDLSAFNLDNLRWNKVVICTDADVDGFQIRTLILTMLYRLTPTLIEKGYVYIAESPLFEITTKDKTYFAYDEPEKDKILKMIGDKSFTIQRSKGLGENEADMMSLTTMNPETRRLIKVNPDDVEMTQWMFNMLLGDDLAGRKEFITNNGADYLEMADIS